MPDFRKGILGSRILGSPANVVGGQGNILGGNQSPSSVTAAPPIPQGPQGPSFSTPAPGVSGVTPGAVERRLAGLSAVPPTMQSNPSMGMPPAQQLSLAGQNTVGADPRSLNDPVMLIRRLLEGGGLQ